MVYFLKVAALLLPLLALKSSVATATRYYSSALLPTSGADRMRNYFMYENKRRNKFLIEYPKLFATDRH